MEVLGQGGMGVVYKARDPVMRRVVALKTLNPDLLGNADLRKRFEREAEAAGALQHTNIVTIFDMGEADGVPYIAMQFLDGESLEKIIARRAAMPLADKLKIVMQFCRGLHYAHTKGVVHRDIKPANIIVTTEGIAKVVDFGIVHLATSTMTQTGQGMGTPYYMSPEQFKGGQVDARSDIFSVGVVMHEFFAYRRPFEGPHIGAIITSILTDEPPALRGLCPEVPRELEEAVRKCLRKVSADRFHSLEDLLSELEPLEQTLRRQMATEMASQAKELLERGDLDGAQEVCQRALALDGTHPTVRALLGQIKADIKRKDVSLRIQQLLGEAEQLWQQGKSEEAIRGLEEVLKLDTQHSSARALLDKARKQKARDDEVRKGLITGKQAYQKGDLTLAESELKKVLALDAENPEAPLLLGKVQQERGARERRYQMREAVWQARKLLSQENYQAALEQLESIPREFSGEEEVEQLLRSAREGVEKRRTVAQEIGAIKALLSEQKFKEAIERASAAQVQFPFEAELGELCELAKSEQQAVERRQRLKWELSGAQDLVNQGRFDEAIQQLGYLGSEFPDEDRVSALIETARDRAQKRRQLEGGLDAIRRLLEEQKFKEAADRAGTIRSEFPQEAEATKLYDFAKTRFESAQRLQQLQQGVVRVEDHLKGEEYDAALEHGERLQEDFPDEPDVRRLVQAARQKVEERRRLDVEFKARSEEASKGEAHASFLGRRLWDLRWYVAAACLAAAVVVAVLMVRRHAQPPPPPPLSMLDVDFTTQPPGATLRIDGQDQGTSPRRLKLAEGTHQLEALMEGYHPLSQPLIVPHASAAPVTLTLQPLALKLQLFTQVRDARVELDGQPSGDIVDGRWVLESVDPGAHTLRVTARGGSEASVSFQVVPADLPALSSPPTTQNLRAVTVSTFVSRGFVKFSFNPGKMISVDDQPALELNRGEFELKDLGKGTHTLAWEKGPVKNTFECDFAPVLAIFLEPESASTTTPKAPVAAVPPKPAPDSGATEIARLRDLAVEAYTKGSYIEPPGESAVDYSNRILQLDPTDQWAKDMIGRSVKARRGVILRTAIASKDFATAHQEAKALKQRFPDRNDGEELEKDIINVETGLRPVLPAQHVEKPAQFRVSHKHVIGSCEGVLTIDSRSIQYRADNGKDSFDVPLKDITYGQVIGGGFYLHPKGGKDWVFHSDSAVDILRMLQRAGSGH